MVIISIPKSGTYLCKEILEQAGLKFMNLHIEPNCDQCAYRTGKKGGRSFVTECNLEQLSEMAVPGSFFIGHLPYNDRTKFLEDLMPVIFLKRELRHAWLSMKRYLESGHGTDGGIYAVSDMKSYLNLVAKIAPWVGHSKIVVDIEEMRNPTRALVNKFSLAGAGVTVGQVKNALDSESLTKNDEFTGLSCWNDSLEREFVGCGGLELNELLVGVRR